MPWRTSTTEPGRPDAVPLNEEGARRRRPRAGSSRGPVRPHLASGLPRTKETAGSWPRQRGRAGRSSASSRRPVLVDPAGGVESEFVTLPRRRPERKRFLGGETVGELFDRVLPALERLVGDQGWDTTLVVAHGAVNRAILSYALTGSEFLGQSSRRRVASTCSTSTAGDGRRVDCPRGQRRPADLVHRTTRLTQMEQYWAQSPPDEGAA